MLRPPTLAAVARGLPPHAARCLRLPSPIPPQRRGRSDYRIVHDKGIGEHLVPARPVPPRPRRTRPAYDASNLVLDLIAEASPAARPFEPPTDGPALSTAWDGASAFDMLWKDQIHQSEADVRAAVIRLKDVMDDVRHRWWGLGEADIMATAMRGGPANSGERKEHLGPVGLVLWYNGVRFPPGQTDAQLLRWAFTIHKKVSRSPPPDVDTVRDLLPEIFGSCHHLNQVRRVVGYVLGQPPLRPVLRAHLPTVADELIRMFGHFADKSESSFTILDIVYMVETVLGHQEGHQLAGAGLVAAIRLARAEPARAMLLLGRKGGLWETDAGMSQLARALEMVRFTGRGTRPRTQRRELLQLLTGVGDPAPSAAESVRALVRDGFARRRPAAAQAYAYYVNLLAQTGAVAAVYHEFRNPPPLTRESLDNIFGCALENMTVPILDLYLNSSAVDAVSASDAFETAAALDHDKMSRSGCKCVMPFVVPDRPRPETVARVREMLGGDTVVLGHALASEMLALGRRGDGVDD